MNLVRRNRIEAKDEAGRAVTGAAGLGVRDSPPPIALCGEHDVLPRGAQETNQRRAHHGEHMSIPLATHVFLVGVPALIVVTSVAYFLLSARRDR